MIQAKPAFLVCLALAPVLALSEIGERTLTGQLEGGEAYVVTEDPSASTASITVEAGVGHLHNPSAIPGLAHLLEHLVFVASAGNDPGGKLNAFIKDHAIAWNGRTTLESTRFTLEVPEEQLASAIRILLAAVYSPALSERAISREIDIIHDEFSDALNRPGYRLEFLAKAGLGEAHAFGRREIGSRETLAIDGIAAQAKAFHQRYYQPGNMGIGIVSKLPAHEMKESLVYAVDPISGRLSATPDRGASPIGRRSCSPPASDGVVAYEDPKYEHSDAVVRFYIPAKDESTRAAAEYIAFLLDFKGEGSLHQALVTHDIADFADAWIPSVASECLVLELTVRLRDAGTDRDGLRVVYSALEAWISTIKIAASDRWRIDERLSSRRNSQEREAPLVFERSVHLATKANKQRSDSNHQQVGTDPGIDRSSLVAILDRIDLASSLFLWPADLDTEQDSAIEPVTRIRFVSQPAPKGATSKVVLVKLGAGFEPPSRNEFLADIKVSEGDRADPVASILETPSQLPEASIFRVLLPDSRQSIIELQVSSSECHATPGCAVAAQLIRNILSGSARIDFAHAYRAGFDIDFDSEGDRVLVTVRGSGEKHDVLIGRILSGLEKLKPTDEEIRSATETLQARIRRFRSSDPVNQLDYAAAVESGSIGWHIHELEQVLEQFPTSELLENVTRFLQALELDIIYVGPDSERIERCGRLAEDSVAGDVNSGRGSPDCTPIHTSGEYERRVLDTSGVNAPNAAVSVLLGKEPGLRAAVAFMLLEKLLSPVYFETLREKAYWVGARFVQHGPYSGVHFRVQSTASTSMDLLEVNEKFIAEIPAMIKAIDESRIEQAKTEAMNHLNAAHTETGAVFDLLKSSVRHGSHDDNVWHRGIPGQFSTFEKADLVSFVERLKDNARVLTVITEGNDETSADDFKEIGVGPGLSHTECAAF